MKSAKYLATLLFVCSSGLYAQNATPAPDPAWAALSFLEGTWEAKTAGGSAGAQSAGTYTFAEELGHNVLSRHSTTLGCKAPTDFDCEHRDLLYIYRDSPGQSIQAIYFDSEGHVLHYAVSTPTKTSAVFVTAASSPGPRFRLTYELKDGAMSGKFEGLMPGQAEWRLYLGWSGAKKPAQ